MPDDGHDGTRPLNDPVFNARDNGGTRPDLRVVSGGKAEETKTPPPDEALLKLFEWSDDAWTIAAIPRRPWVGPPYFMRRQITLVHGPGGASKSLMFCNWAIGLALNKMFGRMKPAGPMRVLLTNFEDDAEEQLRRLSAALEFFEAAPKDLAGKLRRVTLGTTSEATMFQLDERGQLRTTTAWDALLKHCELFKPDVVMLDPLIALNAAPESDNSIMRRVMTTVRSAVAHHFKCSVPIAHHDIKAGGDDASSDQTNSRGAGDIINAARFEVAVKGMTAKDCAAFGMPEEQRKHHFRVGSEYSKRNYGRPEDAEWFERLPMTINGEEVVRALPWVPPSGRLTDEQALAALVEIARGCSEGPYSPQLGDNGRSIGPVLDGLGVAGKDAQRAALVDLKRRHGVVAIAFLRPGHGTHTRMGLRTASGAPHNYRWCDAEGEEAANVV